MSCILKSFVLKNSKKSFKKIKFYITVEPNSDEDSQLKCHFHLSYLLNGGNYKVEKYLSKNIELRRYPPSIWNFHQESENYMAIELQKNLPFYFCTQLPDFVSKRLIGRIISETGLPLDQVLSQLSEFTSHYISDRNLIFYKEIPEMTVAAIKYNSKIKITLKKCLELRQTIINELGPEEAVNYDYENLFSVEKYVLLPLIYQNEIWLRKKN